MCEYKPSVRFILKKVAWTSLWCTKPDDKGCILHEICIWKIKLEFISTVSADLLQVFCNFASKLPKPRATKNKVKQSKEKCFLHYKHNSVLFHRYDHCAIILVCILEIKPEDLEFKCCQKNKQTNQISSNRRKRGKRGDMKTDQIYFSLM